MGRDLAVVRLEREVFSVEEMDLGVRQVLSIRLGSGWNERMIMAAQTARSGGRCSRK